MSELLHELHQQLQPVILYRLASLALIAIAFVVRPQRARCPDRHDLRTGIRRSGAFECWPAVRGDPEYDGTWGKPERGIQPPGIVAGQIYCRAPAIPIVLDNRTVACRRTSQ